MGNGAIDHVPAVLYVTAAVCCALFVFAVVFTAYVVGEVREMRCDLGKLHGQIMSLRMTADDIKSERRPDSWSTEATETRERHTGRIASGHT